MCETINQNAADVSENGTLNKEENSNEKMFTQSQVEEIISERLARERKVNEALLTVKHLLKGASEKGLLKGKSYSEMAKELVERLGEPVANQDDASAMDVLQQNAAEQDNTSLVADKDGNTGTLKENVSGNDKNDGGTETQKHEFFTVLSNIKEKYPEHDIEKMLLGNSFEMFAKGRNASAEEIFDDYYRFMSSLKKQDIKEEQHSNHAELASTAFSSYSGTPDEGTNLTKQQMEIAKNAGMSYREYAHLLESIPKKTGRTF